MKKNYNERTIRDEIGYKIKTIDATRHNRIFASKRLYRYSQRWEVVFFSMNILAVIFLIIIQFVLFYFILFFFFLLFFFIFYK